MNLNKILLIGDLHIAKKNFEQIKCLKEIVKKRLDENPSTTHVVLLGDVYDDPKKEKYKNDEIFLDFVSIFSQKLIVLIGNHDQYDTNINWCNPNRHSLSLLDGVKNDAIEIVSEPKIINIGYLKLACFPYVPPTEFHGVVKKYNINIESCDFVLAHQEFSGSGYKKNSVEKADKYTWQTPCISGHIHTPGENGNVTYIGSAYQTSFTQSSEQYQFITIDESKKVCNIPSGIPNRTIIKITNDQDLENFVMDENSTREWKKLKLEMSREKINTFFSKCGGKENLEKYYTVEVIYPHFDKLQLVVNNQKRNIIEDFFDHIKEKYNELAYLNDLFK